MDAATVANLAEALKRGELPDAQPWDVGAAVQAIADELNRPETLSVNQARSAVAVLNGYRHFDHTRLLAQAWVDRRGFDATVVKHEAQALIELSALDEAEPLLRDGLVKIAASGSQQATSETSEFQGLLGRIAKQRFVATADKDSLAKATDQYLAQYQNDPRHPYWHGINAAALLAREQREGLQRANLVAADELAKTLYGVVSTAYWKNTKDHWLAATAAEACLVMDRCDDAELWLYRFLHHPEVTPFAVESFNRQLREIWEANPTNGGNTCSNRLASILSRHIARTQQRWSLSPSDVVAMEQARKQDPEKLRTDLEKNFSGETSFGLDSIKELLAACKSVGCVINTGGERLGTGFLVRGASLKEALGDSPIFVTNAHVISETVPNAIPPKNALVTFEVESAQAGEPKNYKVGEVLFTSVPGDLGVCCAWSENLDITIVRLEGLAPTAQPLKLAGMLPLVDPKAKAYVIGHPRGSGLQISLQDSLLLDIDDEERLVHYRTPTDPGSSGSPVFNTRWEVMALHHGGSRETPRLHGSGKYEANEGIALAAVKRKLNQ